MLMQLHEPANISLNNKTVSAEVLSVVYTNIISDCNDTCSYYLARVSNDTIAISTKSKFYNTNIPKDTNYVKLPINKNIKIKLFLSPDACCNDSLYTKSSSGVSFDISSNSRVDRGPFSENEAKTDLQGVYETNTYASVRFCYFYYSPDIIGEYIRKECIIEEK